MARKRIPFLLFFLAFGLWAISCQKDDICVEGDTPQLVIGFFDVNDTIEAKSVVNLRIRELTDDLVITTFSDRGTLDSLAIPLRIDAANTGFAFIMDSASDDDGNETGTIDTLTFNYTVNERFVSRACGFVANYNELDTLRQVFTTDWIKRITILDNDIELSNQIHVKIFH